MHYKISIAETFCTTTPEMEITKWIKKKLFMKKTTTTTNYVSLTNLFAKVNTASCLPLDSQADSPTTNSQMEESVLLGQVETLKQAAVNEENKYTTIINIHITFWLIAQRVL